ncbi:hypothetical protein [Clostridium saccharoperbutylacetonicum]|uniref:hypothetical protein n=1 Tax=Clostridium saccharoperbutylacetonicum TaxID=36745 RepID=UPI000983CB73|nr:hypothetical protein [Clostridium saccharoperbutylacetonicum]AQR93096.1 hypothetical protein CLSAP_03710 [Clostridium saccharoperbutylacetonicum]NSB34507.1 hypothetical protein [Clostridium saccharoperbutylacetonicum]
MSMSPENYTGLQKRITQLLNDISYVLDASNLDVELKAISVFEKIIAMETELNITIRNLETVKKSL